MRIDRSSALPVAVVIGGWAGLIGSFIADFVLDLRLRSAGRGELAQFLSTEGALETTVFLPAILSAAVVGSVLILRRPHHPVGWLFLALALTVAVSGTTDGYAAYGAVARPGTLPAADFAAVVADKLFIPWLVLLALILLLTPDGHLTVASGGSPHGPQ